MNKLYVSLALVAGLSTGCADVPVEADNAFGESLAHMVADQTANPAAASENGDSVAQDGEGRRLENVLEAYRTDNAGGVTDVKRDVKITVGN